MWLSNNPVATAALKAADAAYEKARQAACALPLAEKVGALRAAKATRQAAYDAVARLAWNPLPLDRVRISSFPAGLTEPDWSDTGEVIRPTHKDDVPTDHYLIKWDAECGGALLVVHRDRLRKI